ncbi:MAG TPA: BCD family MFS transporter [Anaerolineales bacterium]|nr:BCD family MFS transporter [Anaerolineales bacterium]
MFLKRLQLGLIHTAVAMTLVPFTSTLNRVMIFDLGISKTLFTFITILPYLFSPIQVAIGSFADRHPILGYRRTPHILLGLLFCAAGLGVSSYMVLTIQENFTVGILVGLAAFFLWGMGYHFSAVSYFSLASELSGEKGRGTTIAIMFFMMVLGIIATAQTVSHMVTTPTFEALSRAFWVVAASALTLGLLGLIKLEPRFDRSSSKAASETYTLREMYAVITANPVARVFFIYLLLLLAAILGQDVLLEPFGAQTFGMSISETSRIVSYSQTLTLVAFFVAGFMEGRVAKKKIAQMGNLGAMLGFVLIVVSGFTRNLGIFYVGIMLLGFGTGIATVANLSLMFELTIPEKVGLYIGAWGFSNGLSRLTGLLMAGVVADVATKITGSELDGYLVVFGIEALMLVAAAFMLQRIDAATFRKQAHEPSYVDKVAVVGE